MSDPRALDRLHALGGVLFLALAAISMTLPGLSSLGDVGERGDIPPEEVAAAVHASEWVFGLQSLCLALAGLSLLAFVAAFERAVGPLPLVARAAGFAWAAMLVAGGALTFAAIDLSGHFALPVGAKTALVLAGAFVVSPAVVALAAAFIAGVAWAARDAARFPRWFVRASWAASALVAIGAVGLASYFSGAVGVAALPLWVLVATVVLLRAPTPRA